MYVCVDKKISMSGFRLKRITLALDSLNIYSELNYLMRF